MTKRKEGKVLVKYSQFTENNKRKGKMQRNVVCCLIGRVIFPTVSSKTCNRVFADMCHRSRLLFYAI